MASSHPNNCSVLHLKRESCGIIVKQGDVLEENDVEAIVIPTPKEVDKNMPGYAIFNSLYSRASNNEKQQLGDIQRSITQLKPRTAEFQSMCYILAIPPYLGKEDIALEYLEKTYISCIRCAIEDKIQSIAFPAIGCGNIGFDKKKAAECFYRALEKFDQPKKDKIKEIRIVIFDPKVYDVFSTTIVNLAKQRGAKITLVSIDDGDKTRVASRQESDWSEEDGKRMNDQKESVPNARTRRRGKANREANNNNSTLNPDADEFQPKSSEKERKPQKFDHPNGKTKVIISQGDITKIKVDAIVNAANEDMLGGAGVDRAIHKAAGEELYEACRLHHKLPNGMRLPPGHSRILLSYRMRPQVSYIINTTGPRYYKSDAEQCAKDLKSCYKTAMNLAELYDLESIAFPALSCGAFEYPVDEAAEIALSTVAKEVKRIREIHFVLFDDKMYDQWLDMANRLYSQYKTTDRQDQRDQRDQDGKSGRTKDRDRNTNNCRETTIKSTPS